MSKIIDVDAAKLAGLQMDMLGKYRQGNITLEQLRWFLNLPKERREAMASDRYRIVLHGREQSSLDGRVSLFGAAPFDIDPTPTETDLDLFFKTRRGLYVDGGFNEKLGGAARESVPTQINLTKYHLNERVSDTDIFRTIQEKGLIGSYVFRRMLASQLRKQWKGQEGILRTDGRTELFYVENFGHVHVVRVSFRRELFSNKWLVGVREYDLFYRRPGRFVYSA